MNKLILELDSDQVKELKVILKSTYDDWYNWTRDAVSEVGRGTGKLMLARIIKFQNMLEKKND
jgi:hypothetical protein